MEIAIYRLPIFVVLLLLFDPLFVPSNRSKKDCEKLFLCVESKLGVRIKWQARFEHIGRLLF